MTNYREILRLSSLQYSQRTIESMAHCSRHTVRDVLQAAKEKGMSWPYPTTSPTPIWSSFSFRTSIKHPANTLNQTIRTSTANWRGRA